MRRSGVGTLVTTAVVCVLAACSGRMRSPHDGHSSSSAPMGNGGSAAVGGTATDGGAGGLGRGGSGGSGGTARGGSSGVSGDGYGGTGGDIACTPGIAPTSQVPRLTGAQYDRTVRDLLGVTGLTAAGNAAPSSLLAPDQAGSVTAVAWSAYQSVAEQIAEQVIADASLKANFLTCTPDPADSTCFHDTIVEFGRRAFRRPLVADEVAAFDALVAKGAAITEHGTGDEIAETLLYAFLVSPSFLQRAEIAENSDGSGYFTLSGTEIAQRLSYMLWGSTPDAVLDQAADDDELTTKEAIYTQAERMLADPKAHDMVAAFHRYYLNMGDNTHWSITDHDPTLFPGFTQALVPVMQAEIEKLFDALVFAKQAAFKDLLLTDEAFVTAATAPLYGLDPARFGTDLTETTLDQRPGFLTRIGFLSAYADYSRASPILRGAFITKEVLGLDVGAPPPEAAQTPFPDDPTLDTNRKRYDAITAGQSCVACHHQFINPPGYVLEAYDAVGRFQTVEADTSAPIDTSADIAIDGSGNTLHVANPTELMALLAGSPSAQHQYAEKWTSFVYQRERAPEDECTVEAIASKMTNDGYPILTIAADLTQPDSFRLRAIARP